MARNGQGPNQTQARGKYWCFTLNNYTEQEEKSIKTLVDNNEDVSYVCYGRELGESGTPHLQGYIELRSRLRGNKVLLLQGLSRSHIEIRKGSQHQAIEYCKKDQDFFEFGSKSDISQGKRSDLSIIKDKIDQGVPESDIAEQHFGSWCRYGKAFKEYSYLKRRKGLRDVEVRYIWGPTGCGKTYNAYKAFPNAWISNDPTLQWFNGYSGEDVVILDEYRGGAPDSFILRLLDRYPMEVPIKGGFVPWLPTRIIITSNLAPEDMHNAVGPAFRRRLKTMEVGQNLNDGNWREDQVRELIEFLQGSGGESEFFMDFSPVRERRRPVLQRESSPIFGHIRSRSRSRERPEGMLAPTYPFDDVIDLTQD